VAIILKVIYNFHFRHRGIPTKLEMSMTDFGLWRYSKNGDSHLKVQELHKELGIEIPPRLALISRGRCSNSTESYQLHVSLGSGRYLRNEEWSPESPNLRSGASTSEFPHQFSYRHVDSPPLLFNSVANF
jgi:hypothetical protein